MRLIATHWKRATKLPWLAVTDLWLWSNQRDWQKNRAFCVSVIQLYTISTKSGNWPMLIPDMDLNVTSNSLKPGEQILFKSYVPVMVRVIVVIIVLDPSKWARRPGRYACAAHWPGIVGAGIVDGGWNQHTKEKTWVKLTSWKRSENECLKHHPHKTIYGALLSAANTFDIQSPIHRPFLPGSCILPRRVENSSCSKASRYIFLYVQILPILHCKKVEG